jgi:hypothetical protein
MARTLIILGLVLVGVGLLWPWLGKLPLGRLPGDLVIEREGVTIYLPLGTGLLLSVILSALLWLLNR